MRDIILGVTPPAAFSKPVYVLFSVLTATLLFTIVYTNPSILDSGFKSKYYDTIMLLCDTLGLGIFTVVGIQAAANVMNKDNAFFFVFVGVLTGVGGGVVRDIMAGETPYILVREIYACASIAGGAACVICRNSVGEAARCNYRLDCDCRHPSPRFLFSLEFMENPLIRGFILFFRVLYS